MMIERVPFALKDRIYSFNATRAARPVDGMIGVSSSKIASTRRPADCVPTMLEPLVWMYAFPVPSIAFSMARADGS